MKMILLIIMIEIMIMIIIIIEIMIMILMKIILNIFLATGQDVLRIANDNHDYDDHDASLMIKKMIMKIIVILKFVRTMLFLAMIVIKVVS